MGRIYYEQKEFARSIEYLEKAINSSNYSDFLDDYFRLSHAFRMTGRFDRSTDLVIKILARRQIKIIRRRTIVR